MHANIILSVLLFPSWFSSSFGVLANEHLQIAGQSKCSSNPLESWWRTFSFLCRRNPLLFMVGSCTRRQTSKTVLTQSNFKPAGSLYFQPIIYYRQSYGEELLMMISFLWVAFVLGRKKVPTKGPITIEMEGRGLGFYDKQDSPFTSKCTSA